MKEGVAMAIAECEEMSNPLSPPPYYESLHDKLYAIAQLEREGGFFGVRFTLRDRAEQNLLTTEDVVDDVRAFLTSVIADADTWDDTPWAEAY